MRIVISGPGALGCLLGARISSCLQPDETLTLLDHRRERAQQINNHGFFLEIEGEDQHSTIPATADPTRISGCDLFFLCTRPFDVVEALSQATDLLSPGTLLICFQRGISHLQAVENCRASAAAAVSTADVFLKSPSRFCCLTTGISRINLLSNSSSGEQMLDKAVALLNRAGLHTEATEDIRQQIMDRFFIDLAVNAPAAIYKRQIGQLMTSCSVRSNMKKMLNEAAAVAAANNLAGSGDPIKTTFKFLRSEKNRIAPMLRDIDNKRPTEIDALNGAIAEMGKKVDIPTPVNQDFVNRIKSIEASYL